MLKLFNHEEHLAAPAGRNVDLLYYASELMEHIGLSEPQELTEAIERAKKVCAFLHIAVEENFKPIYRSYGNNISADWKLSSLACYLLTINTNSINEKVAKAQLYFATRRFKNV